MKLLLDQNISLKLVKKLHFIYPDSAHIKDFGLERRADADIWDFAKHNNFVIVTRDVDFFEIGLLRGYPPKIIWIQANNPASDYVKELLIDNKDVITSFVSASETFCLRLL